MTTPKTPEEVPTEPSMGAITDRQLLVDAVQKLASLYATVKDGFASSAARDLDLSHRVTGLEQWRHDVDDRMSRNSARADQPSKHDLEAQAALAAETAAREALAKEVSGIKTEVSEIKVDTKAQTEIMTRVESAVVTFWKSQPGRAIQWLAWGAFLGWLAKNNIHIPGINP